MENLKSISSIIEPISDYIKFFFTIKGLLILLAVLLVYLFLDIFLDIKRNGFSSKKKKYKFFEFTGILLTRFVKGFYSLVTNIPTLLVVGAVALSLVAISESIDTVIDYFGKLQRISELETVLRQLNDDRPIARIEIKAKTDNNITAVIEFLNPNLANANKNRIIDKIDVNLEGNMIYMGFRTINFEYSRIESGECRNITIPDIIYTDSIPSDEGLKVDYSNDNGVFYSLIRDDEDIYGIPPENYNERAAEISKFFSDKNFARTNGVRSINGQAVAKILDVDDVFYVFTKQTGGLEIRLQEDRLR